MGNWRPQTDHDRPYNPYYPGFTARIEPHTPPAPFGRPDYRHRGCPRSSPPMNWRADNVTQAQMTLLHPPLETEHQANSKANPANRIGTSSLVITKSIVIGNSRSSQVVLCTITPTDGSSFQAVAKLYDALYYLYYRFYYPSTSESQVPDDVCRDADGRYSREAAVYEHLTKAGMTGGFAPEYYGSWTMYLPIIARLGEGGEEKEHLRPVRLILMEAIDGPTMRSVFLKNHPIWASEPDAYHLPEAYRLDVMARILDGKTRQFHAGICTRGHYPNGFIITPDPNTSCPPPPATRVVMVDYNYSTVFELTERGLTSLHENPLPPNPWDRWCDSNFHEYIGWAPECWAPECWHTWWDKQEEMKGKKHKLEWLEGCFEGDNRGEYEPLEEMWTFEKEEAKLRERDELERQEREEIEEQRKKEEEEIEEQRKKEDEEEKEMERQAEEEAKQREEAWEDDMPIYITIQR